MHSSYLACFATLKSDCVIKTSEMLIFLPLINSSVAIEISFLLLIVSAIILLNWILQYFYKHLAYRLSIQ